MNVTRSNTTDVYDFLATTLVDRSDPVTDKNNDKPFGFKAEHSFIRKYTLSIGSGKLGLLPQRLKYKRPANAYHSSDQFL